MKAILTTQSLSWAIPLVLLAVIIDITISPKAAVQSDGARSLTYRDVSYIDEPMPKSEEVSSLLAHFASINPLKAKEAEEVIDGKVEVESTEKALEAGEKKIMSSAIRLSAVFEQKNSMFAVIQLRNLETGEVSREVLKANSVLSSYKVTHIGRDRIVLDNNDADTLELILFKQK
ncbi:MULTISPECIES: hypothetical protein [Vibrio harveyi group]|uniref:hypothetical protein n=1 Tax=Vibrio harveyi group TaxID=717610 RepID=UPI000BAF3397|nr:hypothetical protein [Vibrio sp. V1B]PAW11009.1 hypothetical protein B6K85_09090 [Vibrio sp. V1B]